MKHAYLWKRILNGNVSFWKELPTDACDMVVQRLVTAVLITSPVTNASGKQEGEDWGWEGFTGIAVPFPHFWVEGTIPVRDGMPRPLAWGVLVNTVGEGRHNLWVFQECIANDGSVNPFCVGALTIGIGADGRFDAADMRSPKYMHLSSRLASVNPGGMEAVTDHVRTLTMFLLEALQLLGCRNVALESRENDPKEVRRAAKRYGLSAAGYRYHVLVVRPPGARSDAPAQEIGSMPRHICRGHFAEYGPEYGKGLLFGKHVGRFFIPPHLKGKKENGIVEKDYAIA